MGEEPESKRRFQRYLVDLEAVLYQAGETAIGRIRQISRGGCLLVAPAGMTAQGLELRLSFQLSGDLPSINCKGETVYYISGRGAGVAFAEISPYSQDLITNFFEKQPLRES